MSKITRVAMLAISLVSLFGALSSVASAGTWTNSGDTLFHATAGAGTLSGNGVNLTCATSTASGDIPETSTGPVIGRGTATFTNCRVAGTTAVQVHCGFALTASSISGAVTTGNVDVTCDMFQLGTQTCHISGPTPATYTNPGTNGILALSTAATLTVTDGAQRCPLGNGVRGHLSPLNFVTTGSGPIIRMV